MLANKEEVTPFVGTGATIAVLPKNPHARWDALLADGIRECEKLGLSTAWAESTTARLQFGDLITYLSVADAPAVGLVSSENGTTGSRGQLAVSQSQAAQP